MVGGVGQRMLTSVAKKMAGEFFAAVEKDLVSPAPAPRVSPGEQALPARRGPMPSDVGVYTRVEEPAPGAS